MAARETANRLRGRTRAGMGSGRALYDREHAGRGRETFFGHRQRCQRRRVGVALLWRVLALGSRRISKVEKENVSSPKQGFIPVPGSFDVHVRIPKILPAIPWMV